MVTIPTIDQISGSTVMRKMRDLINHFITFAGEVDDELTTLDNRFDGYYTKVEVDGNFYTKSYINTNYYDKTSVDYLLNRKADLFTLGNGLTSYDNQIFAKVDGTSITFDSSGNLKANVDTSNFYTKIEVDDLLDDKQNVLTAGTGISITNDVISVTNAFDPTQYYTKTATDGLLDDKQDVLTAGTGIDITNNVISVTGGSGGSDWEVVTTTDWRTGIVNVQTDLNAITFLKDCCICTISSNASSEVVFIPKGSKFYANNYIIFRKLMNIATSGSSLTFVSFTHFSAILSDIFADSATFSCKYGVIKVEGNTASMSAQTNASQTKLTSITNSQGVYLLVR